MNRLPRDDPWKDYVELVKVSRSGGHNINADALLQTKKGRQELNKALKWVRSKEMKNNAN